MPKLPYLYLAFANDPEHPLPNLRKEGEELYQMLLQRKDQDHFDIHRDESVSIQVISQNLRRFKDRVIVFHYGGHAASEALFLYGQQANADGIAELLGQQKNLKLVFLNGCSTQAQVDYLKSLGVPAVIATSRPIDDGLATQFATDFYGALVHNHTLREAFDHAAAGLKSANKSVRCIRGIMLESEVGTDTWILSVADEAHYSWKLPRELLPEPDSKFGHTLSLPSLVPEIFLGREDDLLRIHDKLFSTGGNMLLLNGEGGLGKTSLAARYFDRYKAEYAHVAWVTSNRNLADAVLTLAAPLGLIEEESFLRDDIPQRIEKLLTEMSNLPRPCLLVIDNANELEDLEAYYPQLQRCSNFH
ncbi:MAG: CHAT domain-containing protein, partial [Haliscomenobacter sp.]